MKEALFYKQLGEERVLCELCPRGCVIPKGKYGWCNARMNSEGTLFSVVYGKPASFNIDPIEKKPLYHFLPGSEALSFGTVGCNMGCLHCQNYELSRSIPENIQVKETMPEEIVNIALNNKCESIAYTYNEPAVNFEFVLETAKLARQNSIRNVLVSNGYINREPLETLIPFIDGNNVDLKGFNPEFYQKECMAELAPVLDTLKILKEKKVWLEITNLIIPTLNDNMEEIEAMCKWIAENLGRETPLHFSRFFPYHKAAHLPMTPAETLAKAREIAQKHLDFVYVGNLVTTDWDNTFCPKCKALVIERSSGFGILQNNMKNVCCPNGHIIPGIWE